MSAGGISYSGLRTARKVTLPSVEMWNSELNLLRDPPKSIHTRRRDKVGDTQQILLAQDESGDRICENINVYARGVNPMVEVSYDNFSNNSGKRNVFQNQAQASLPYKVENVRPPVLRQEDLLPLSRMPRTWFYSFSNPSLPGVVNEASCAETGSSVHDQIINAKAFTNKKYDLVEDNTVPREAARHTLVTDVLKMTTDARKSRPIESLEGYDTGKEKASIQTNKLDVRADTKKIRDQASGVYIGGINQKIREDPLNARALTNRGAEGRNTEMSSNFCSVENGRTRDALNAQAQTNISSGEREAVSEFDKQDPKQIQRNKRFYQAFARRNRDISTLHEHHKLDLSKFLNKKKVLCVAQTNRRVKEQFVNPFQDSVVSSTVPIKDYLSKNVKTVPTSVYNHTRPEMDTEKVKGLIENPLHVFDLQAVRTANRDHSTEMVEAIDKSSLRQNMIYPEARSNHSQVGEFVDPFENSYLNLHNQKRTPIHSVRTNTVSPFTKTNEPEYIPEQKRRSLLVETSTTETDMDQILNNADPYAVQSTNATKLVYNGPAFGSFEGNGSAVPLFDRYENYQPSLRKSARDEVRSKTTDMFSDRYPTPSFVQVN